MRPHPRRARTNAQHPRAWATSDRGGWIGNQENLQWQYQWAGTQLINTRILCYPDELDVPQRQLGSIILPPDPVSIPNARIEPYPIDEVWPVLHEIASSNSGGATSGVPGPNDAQPVYLEISSVSANYPVPNTPQPTTGMALETSSVPMQAATS